MAGFKPNSPAHRLQYDCAKIDFALRRVRKRLVKTPLLLIDVSAPAGLVNLLGFLLRS
jgi:hypothetical protein